MPSLRIATHHARRLSLPLLTAVLLVCAVATTPPTYAATYAAQKMITSKVPTTLTQLQPYTYAIGFKNIGSTTWSSAGTDRITAKTTQNVRYEHWFSSHLWIDKLTVTSMTPNTVAPGQVAYFNLPLEAPQKNATFNNMFAVFAGDKKIEGSDFSLTLTVGNTASSTNTQTTSTPTASAPAAVPTPVPTSSATTATADTLRTNPYATATPLIKSAQSLSLQAGAAATFTIGIKNTGDRNWRNVSPSLVALNFDPSSTANVSFKDSSWVSSIVILNQSAPLTQPSELGFFSFIIKAPTMGGQYNPEFYLTLNGDTLIEGSRFHLPISVAMPAPVVTPSAPPTTTSSPTIVCIAADQNQDLEQDPGNPSESGLCQPSHTEPIMRVGIDKLEGQLGVTANLPYIIRDNAGKEFVKVAAGMTTFLSYNAATGAYTAVSPGPLITSPLPLQVVAATDPSIITLTTFSNPVAYHPGWNDNTYRGAIEIRWSEADQKVWIINELPMEDYLRGLAESSNAAEPEYQKALITAARSYALYHHDASTKHLARHFDVVATVSDQYYRGYESEKRLPAVSTAVDATRGQVVTYNGSVVVTPYSASTDGTTRSWEDVWGGTPKPWLVRKPVPEDVGRQRFGHGVGMSQLAANDMAKKGKNYLDILTFFYVNTNIAQWYN
ncbi:hypothetical protein COV04_02270 [Candidatus Uhrbacteria bacterium CG10_big_fil_rev_8_21_14_0_10_48_11]|uniref:Sporulation stage II protein D amidase enhancer LytB N-terminal domain-containing protein n=1 Tax=Candidatus Uhrbacteria bacterium CG10_big_fil_rev_8_21_14_0_10_48_11 TaxID=1975037 RepID=A0A2M8LEV2_9BACT|nr:MAG: hypothetical protein COV04_02270 [Candidatus Uhrbacteria bacterium CG10_big_fil_rev_8_21_14_0_10_48_11]